MTTAEPTNEPREPQDGRATARTAQRHLIGRLDAQATAIAEYAGRTDSTAVPPMSLQDAIDILESCSGSVLRLDPQARLELFDEIMRRHGEQDSHRPGLYTRESQRTVADVLHTSVQTIRRVRRVMEATADDTLPPELRYFATNRLAYINDTGQVSGAADQVFQMVAAFREEHGDKPDGKPAELPGTYLGRPVVNQARKQRATLTRLVHSVSGIAASGDRFADELLPLDVLFETGQLDPKQVKAMAAQLRDARAALMKLINRISGKPTGRPSTAKEEEPTT
jgi:hypothetical protein